MPEHNSQTDFQNISESHRRQFLQMVGAAGGAGMSVLAGCTDSQDSGTAGGNGSGNNESDNSMPSSTDEMGGTLIAGTQADIVKLDPHATTAYSSLQVLENIYQKPTALTPDLEPEGQLAKDWTISDEGTTWTFDLHEGVMFHQPVSREMTAGDIVYSIQRILDEDTGSPRRSNFQPIKNMSVKDDYTLVFEFDKPYAPFPYKLTTAYVMPKGAGDASDYDITQQPVGTGPFQFAENVSQSRTVIEAFDNYWEKDESGNQLPYLDAVRYKPVPEGSSRITNLRTGELDWIDTMPRSQASSVENDNNVHFSSNPGTFYDYLGKNMEEKPLDDKKLRQAISYGVNRQAISQGARFGYGTATYDPCPPASAWKDLINMDPSYAQNKEKAKSLIEESSYSGENIEIMVGQQYKGQVNEAEIVQEQLSGIGINVNVSPTEWGTMVARLNSGDYQMSLVGWIGFVDPDSMFYNVFHTDEKFNQVNYSNKEVDQLLEKGRTITGSREKRAEPYDKALDIIGEDAPYTFLNFNGELMAWKKYVNGFTHYPTGTIRFKTTWKAQAN